MNLKADEAVLLVNLGSPKELNKRSIREYLRIFLSDDYVVDLPKILQQLILYLFILPFRPRKTLHAYSQIWTEFGSPLIISSRNIQKKLAKKTGWKVSLAMRYEDPSIKDALEELKEHSYKKIYVIPLYPHYAMSTSKTTQREVKRVRDKLNLKIDLEFVDSFHNANGYIDALCEIIKNKMQPQSEFLLFSYHGIPNRHLKKTDPTKKHCLQSKNCCEMESLAKPYCYKAQVIETSRLCADSLDMKSSEWGISFQSRIGPGWMKPFTDIELKKLAEKGIKNLDVVCPSFVIDNLETLEEMNLRGRETFLEAGGENFNYIPCLNQNSLWLDFLEDMVKK